MQPQQKPCSNSRLFWRPRSGRSTRLTTALLLVGGWPAASDLCWSTPVLCCSCWGQPGVPWRATVSRVSWPLTVPWTCWTAMEPPNWPSPRRTSKLTEILPTARNNSYQDWPRAISRRLKRSASTTRCAIVASRSVRPIGRWRQSQFRSAAALSCNNRCRATRSWGNRAGGWCGRPAPMEPERFSSAWRANKRR